MIVNAPCYVRTCYVVRNTKRHGARVISRENLSLTTGEGVISIEKGNRCVKRARIYERPLSCCVTASVYRRGFFFSASRHCTRSSGPSGTFGQCSALFRVEGESAGGEGLMVALRFQVA